MTDCGTVKLAASPIMLYYLIAPGIAGFKGQRLNVHFELYELSTREAAEWVVNRKVDFGTVSLGEDHPKLVVEVLYQDRMHAIMHHQHEFT